jgi:hypothetical protein
MGQKDLPILTSEAFRAASTIVYNGIDFNRKLSKLSQALMWRMKIINW